MAYTRKKPNTQAAKARRKPPAKGDLDRRWSILLFGLGLLVVVFTLVGGESAWAWARQNILFGALGASAWVLGPLLIYWAVCIASERPVFPAVIRGVVFLVALSGAALVFGGADFAGRSFPEVLADAHAGGMEQAFGGGILGLLVGGSLLALAGPVAARVLLILAMLVAAMILTGVSPGDIVRFFRRAGDRLSERFEDVEEDFEEEVAAPFAGAGGPRRRGEPPVAAREAPPRPARPVRGVDVPLEGAAGRMAPAAPAPRANARMGSVDIPLGGASAPAQAAQPLFEGARFRDSRVDIRLGQTRAHTAQGPAAPVPTGPGGTFGKAAAEEAAARAGKAPAENVEEEYGLGDDFAPLIGFGPGAAVDAAAPPPRGDVLLFGEDDPYAHLGGAQSRLPAGSLLDVEYIPPAQAAADPAFDLFGNPMPGASGPAPAAQGQGPRGVAAANAQGEGTPPAGPQQARPEQDENEANLDKLLDKASEVKEDRIPAGGDMRGLGDVVMPYRYPPSSLFEPPPRESLSGVRDEMKTTADLLVSTLQSFGVETRILDVSRGPSVTRYEIQPQAGVKISRITNLADDIALNLAAAGVRIEAPIPGKPAVGIEVPNRVKGAVPIRGILESSAFADAASPLSIALGKDIAGDVVVADLTRMPHLLIAGSTGSGKSVCINSVIMSFLYKSSPEEVRLILIDPKVVELAEYNGIPHLLIPVVTEPRQAAKALGYAVNEMEKRYRLFAQHNTRDITSFNKMARRTGKEEPIPHIAIIIDELADLMMVAGKDVENFICRIAQKARAAGMHLIVATQRPSVDVITGLIKANIPSRIAFAVSSQVDSRTILDGAGAEKLLGMGDMLFMPIGVNKPMRVQGTFVKDREISRVLQHVKAHARAAYDEDVLAEMDKVLLSGAAKDPDADGGEEAADVLADETFQSAVEMALDAGEISTSGLQRRLRLGYARAGRLVDQMEQMGIISEPNGAKPRQVLISRQAWQEMVLNHTD